MTDTTRPDQPAVDGPVPTVSRRFRLRELLFVALLAAVVAGVSGYLVARQSASTHAEAKKTLYQCPMHPTVIQDHPGECPICGMKLVKMGEPGAPSGERKIGNGSPVQGLATIEIDPARQQLIGLKTADVTRGQVGGAWRTVGRVAIDERRVRHVAIKVPVYVERIYVDFIGKPVRRGAPLFSAYSPELLAAQDEYRIALQTQKTLSSASEYQIDNSGLVAATRRKLELWDLPKSAIERLEKTGESQKTVTFHSPIAGVVTKKDVVDGMKLDAGAMPYEIVDLKRVWVLADVHESELGRVQLDMNAKLTLKAYPNRVFEGVVAFIDPVLDPRTRTVKVRLEFPNESGELKPEMFGEVVLEGPSREGLRIPEDAVIHSGTKNVVFIALGAGKFAPRAVEVGTSDGSSVEVVSGLSEGEKVVVRANFLVDSESRLRASLASLTDSTGDRAPAKVPSKSIAPKEKHEAHSMSAPPSAAPEKQTAPMFACPMHPEVTDTKRSRCPKCGMYLEPVERK